MLTNQYVCSSNLYLTKKLILLLCLSCKAIDFVQGTKCLGVILNSQLKTSVDVSRQTRKFYAQANMTLRNIMYCSVDVNACCLDHIELTCTTVLYGSIPHLVVPRNLKLATIVCYDVNY